MYTNYLVRKLQEGDETFMVWLSRYEIDAYSGSLPADQTQYGFPLPERQADSLWYSPTQKEVRALALLW